MTAGMSGGGVNVDTAAGLATTQKVSGIVDEMQQCIKRIAGAADTGLASWDGNASRAFDNVHTDWNSSAIKLQAALDDIKNKLNTGFRGYEDHDHTAAAGIPSNGTLNL